MGQHAQLPPGRRQTKLSGQAAPLPSAPRAHSRRGALERPCKQAWELISTTLRKSGITFVTPDQVACGQRKQQAASGQRSRCRALLQAGAGVMQPLPPPLHVALTLPAPPAPPPPPPLRRWRARARAR